MSSVKINVSVPRQELKVVCPCCRRVAKHPGDGSGGAPTTLVPKLVEHGAPSPLPKNRPPLEAILAMQNAACRVICFSCREAFLVHIEAKVDYTIRAWVIKQALGPELEEETRTI